MADLRKKVLIVDDETVLWATHEKVLTSSHVKAISAKIVKHAQEIIALGEVDLVTTDTKMPDMNEIYFLHWIKANYPLPVIQMTGFSEILETKEAARIGADAVLAKPFRREDLLDAFCHQVILGPDSPGLMSPEGLKRMLSLNPEYYDPATLEPLKKLFEVKAPAPAAIISLDDA